MLRATGNGCGSGVSKPNASVQPRFPHGLTFLVRTLKLPLVGDDRVPGNGEPKAMTYVCPVPGCYETRIATHPPTCGVHRIRMEKRSS
jgi:hypothetical protein